MASYGDVGRALKHPMTGYQVGRIIARCPEGVPWWRVVAKDGRLPIGKRDPRLQKEQCELLAEEGVEVTDGAVDMSRYGTAP